MLIAPPDLFEWVPTSSGPKPSLSDPISLTVLRIVLRNRSDGICFVLPFSNMVLMGVFGSRLGFLIALQAQMMSEIQAFTGHMCPPSMESSERW